MDNNVIFSGVQPSGNLHIGNYIGAIRQWIDIQNSKFQIPNSKQIQNSNNKTININNITIEQYNNELIFCIVDLHAITVYQDPKVLRTKILELAALYIACGLDPAKSTLFVQSDNVYHTYLAWILDCVIPLGWMGRMTQFKEKSAKQKESSSVGLFNYPALQAADILLYNTTLVPVGEDQVQHVELARDAAKRFNSIYGDTFTIPQAQVVKGTSRIMSLSDATSKMSKSDKDAQGTLFLTDEPEMIKRKIARAVTDSGSDIVYDPIHKPSISNLLVIFSSFAGQPIGMVEKRFSGASYAVFKSELTDLLVAKLGPIQSEYKKLITDPHHLRAILQKGAQKTTQSASLTIQKVVGKMGLGFKK